MDQLAPWAGLVVVVIGWAWSSGKMAGAIDRLSPALDRLAERVDDHDARIGRVEGVLDID
jgi:hypothetical protein